MYPHHPVGGHDGMHGMPGVVPADDPCNLIVNYLPPEVDEHGLMELFRPFGRIVSCSLVRDPHNNASCCYGFVRYSMATEAAAAISALHERPMGSKRLRVQPSRSRQKQRGPLVPTPHGPPRGFLPMTSPLPTTMDSMSTGTTTFVLHIQGLESSTTTISDVRRLLHQAGVDADTVAAARVMILSEGASEYVAAVVRMPVAPSAYYSVQEVLERGTLSSNGTRSGSAAADPVRFHSCHVFTAPDVFAMLDGLAPVESPHGRTIDSLGHDETSTTSDVSHVSVPSQPHSMPMGSRPTMVDSSELPGDEWHGLLDLDSIMFEHGIAPLPTSTDHRGMAMVMSRAPPPGMTPAPGGRMPANVHTPRSLPRPFVPPASAPEVIRLYVSNLPPHATDAAVTGLFARFGGACKVELMRRFRTDQCKGFGFVDMKSASEASLAIQGLNGRAFPELGFHRPLVVEIKSGSFNPDMNPTGIPPPAAAPMTFVHTVHGPSAMMLGAAYGGLGPYHGSYAAASSAVLPMVPGSSLPPTPSGGFSTSGSMSVSTGFSGGGSGPPSHGATW